MRLGVGVVGSARADGAANGTQQLTEEWKEGPDFTWA